MKKIAAIGHNYYPELTGIGKYTSEFCDYLANEKSFSVDVITGNPYYPGWKIFDGYKNIWFTKENINNVNVYRCPLFIPKNPGGFKRLLQDGFFLTCVFIMINYLLIFHRKKYDFIFIAAPSSLLGLAGLYYRIFSRKTVVLYHIQDLQIDAATNLGMIKNKFLLKILFSLEKFILIHVNHVSTISEGMREKVLAKTSKLKECLLFPNWINSKNFYPIFPKPNIDDKAFKNKKIIFYSGAIGEKQGLEIILAAAEYFNGRNDFLFLISGEGPYKEKLREMALQKLLGNVVFSKLMPLQEFNEMLNAAHLHLIIQKAGGSDFFLPSKLTNILAIGGCAVVTAAANTSLYNIISENNCGYLIPPSDIAQLCCALDALEKDENLRNDISKNAFNYAAQFLYQKTVTDNYLLQSEIIAKKNI